MMKEKEGERKEEMGQIRRMGRMYFLDEMDIMDKTTVS
jgi:hypothetical protein